MSNGISAYALSPLPLWERVARAGAIAKREPGEGCETSSYADPSPVLARLRLRSDTLSHKGRGEESMPV